MAYQDYDHAADEARWLTSHDPIHHMYGVHMTSDGYQVADLTLERA